MNGFIMKNDVFKDTYGLKKFNCEINHKIFGVKISQITP